MHHPEIAIVDPNTLTCLGLKNILEDIIPMATIRVFHSFGELTDDTPDMYAHYFISAQIYFEHTSFFLLRKPKTIVLAGGDNQPQLSGVSSVSSPKEWNTRIVAIGLISSENDLQHICGRIQMRPYK